MAYIDVQRLLMISRILALALAVVTGILVYLLLHLDLTALEVTGTVVMAAATIALAWFGGVQIMGARRQQRGVAATLLVEALRIRSELGAPLKQGESIGAVAHSVMTPDALPPQVHPWIHQVIPQIAETNANIVASFLWLDHDLHNYKALIGYLNAARSRFKAEQQADVDFHVQYPTPESEPATLAQRIAAGLTSARTNLETATERVTETYRDCHKTLDDIEGALRQMVSISKPNEPTADS